MNKEKLAKRIPYIFTGLLIAGLVAAYFLSPAFKSNIQEGWSLIMQGDRQAVTRYFRSFGFWGPVIIILFMFLQMITIVLPSWLLMVVAVLGYGPVWGTILSVGGITLVAIIAYWIGHGLGEGVLSRFIGNKTEKKMDKFIKEYGIGAVALFRLSPFLSNDAVSFVAGMLDMKFWHFLIGTIAGITPLAIALAIFSDSPETLKNGLIWVGAGGILLYGIYVWLDWRGGKKSKVEGVEHKEEIRIP